MIKELLKERCREITLRADVNNAIRRLSRGMALTVQESFEVYNYIEKLEKEIIKNENNR